MRLRVAAAVVVTAVLVTAGCTDTDEPGNAGTPASGPPGAGASSSMTFEEAYRQVPLDGVGGLKISWEVPQSADEVLAARRSLAHVYWRSQAADWTPVLAVAPFLFTEQYYQQVLEGLGTSGAGDPMIGPIWVRLMGVEQLGPDQARVTFCTDIGWWHPTSDTGAQVRKNRANLESFVMRNVRSGEGERHWLADQRFNPDADREAKYGAQCSEWAQHQP